MTLPCKFLNINFPPSVLIDFKGIMVCRARALASADWLCYGALCVERAVSQQQFQMYRYVPTVGVALSKVCKSEMKFRIEFPRAQSMFHTLQERQSSIVRSFIQGKGPCVSSDNRSCVMDFIPYFLTIVNPPLRPVGFNLYNSREKKQAQALVDILVAYGCTFSGRASTQTDDAVYADRFYELTP